MKIAILGYGVEGRAAAEYFADEEVTICDANENLKISMPAGMKSRKPSVLGVDYLKNLDDFDLLVRSPGISSNKKELKGLKDKLTSGTKIFFEKCPAPIIGITGTKGKGTTASLLHEMLTESGRRVFLGGNIGTSPLSFLNELDKDCLVVLELSSFQLMDLEVSPHLAVVLGITPDHLDYHKDFEEYLLAKRNIVAHQKSKDFAVIDVDSDVSLEFEEASDAQVRRVSNQKILNEGAFVKVDRFMLVNKDEGQIFGERGTTRLIGEHNVKNILMAACAADTLGVPLNIIQDVARSFKGLPHRLEHIAKKNGVDFYNDSASTNPHTTIAAIRAIKKPTILILGGSSKNVDFRELAREIVNSESVKSVVILGQTKREIEKAIDVEAKEERIKAFELAAKKKKDPTPAKKLDLILAESVPEAFMAAKIVAQEGDAVLLSPACASFDMFANYTERGDVFRNFVLDT